MSAHKKLQQARVQLQGKQLKKSGHNKFAGYEYFELGDFLPAIQEIFNDIGLCGTLKFEQQAELRICDVDKTEDYIIFSCPIAQASLKGCHEVQNLGASITYLRRYLWVNALEIVEHDALDATTGNEKVKGVVHRPVDNPDFTPNDEELEYLNGVVKKIYMHGNSFGEAKAYLESENLDADEKAWIWGKLDSKTRSGIKAVK